MGQKNRNIILWVSAFLDLFINLSTILVAFFMMHMYLESFEKLEMAITIGLTILTTFIYILFSLYNLKRNERLRVKLFKTFLAQFTAYTIFLILITATGPNKYYYIFASICTGISLVLISIKRIITTKLLHIFRARRSNDREILIVGYTDGAIAFAEQLNKNMHFGYNILGIVCDEEEPDGFEKLGEISDLDEVIKKHNPFEVVIAIDSSAYDNMQRIIDACETNGIRTLIVPATHKYFKSKCQVDMIGDLPVINTRAIPLDNIANMAVKRLMDIVISLILIVLTLPIMLVAMIGVKLSSKGPVIFKQKRVGKNNKVFTMYKFRSMKINAESDTAWTTNNDPRKTRFGTFMRKTGIDELPQLFNVLFGSMSIIGPRPELPAFVEQYSKTIPLYRIKHQVKPGITGLAQIYGFRGDTSIEKRIELDIEYIENWSLVNDIKILVITPFKMFNRNEKYEK